jgi:hypothetical protein
MIMKRRTAEEWAEFLELRSDDEEGSDAFELRDLVEELNNLDVWEFGDDVHKPSAIIGAAIMLLQIMRETAVTLDVRDGKLCATLGLFADSSGAVSKPIRIDDWLWWVDDNLPHPDDKRQRKREVLAVASQFEKLAKKLRAKAGRRK